MAMVVARTGPPAGGYGEDLPFEQVCMCFEELSRPDGKTAERGRKPRIMQKLWDKYGTDKHGLFPLMRLTLPLLDTVRPQYRCKQKMLGRMYVDILSINEASADAQQMLNWKKPTSGFARNEQGNFPEMVYAVIEPRAKKRSDLASHLTIRGLNDLLDKLATADGFHEKRDVMRELIMATTAREQRWALRVITKDMHIGMKEDSVFRMLHPDAKELYNSCCDLRATCEQCRDPNYRLNDISLQVFKPLKPRLATRADWNTVHKILSRRGEYVAEYKLDGERLMLHFARHAGPNGADRAQWFTRNCKDFTQYYGEVFAPTLNACVTAGLHDVILDGEMMVWKEATGEYAAFGENRSLSDFRRRFEQGYTPCYVVFDVLWLNGSGLASLTLAERRARVQPLIAWKAHAFELAKQWVVQPDEYGDPPTKTHTQEVMVWLDRAMAKGYEGIMFKSLTSTYEPGSRDDNWLKLKPDYVHDMGDELDLLIIGGYYGEGQRRGGGISHFLLGLKAPRHAAAVAGAAVAHPLFYPFCKVGTGYTKDRLAQLVEELREGTHIWDKHNRPAHLCGWKPNKTDDEPDVWFEPAKSQIMSCIAYEMVEGDSFRPCGFTLRFPRCRRIRDPADKPWSQCETHDDLYRRLKEQKGKIAASKRSAADIAFANPDDLKYGGAGSLNARKKKEGTKKAVVRAVGVLAHTRIDQRALAKIPRDSDCLGGVVAYVSGAGSQDPTAPTSLPRLQELIHRLGGRVDASFNMETNLIVDADDPSGASTLQRIAKAERESERQFDIVRASWLLACAEANEKVPLEPRYVCYASAETASTMEVTMDRFGDSFMEIATEASFEQALRLVRVEHKRQRTEANATAGSGSNSLLQARLEAAATAQMHSAWSERLIAEKLKALPDDDVAALVDAGVASALLGVVAYAPRPAIRLRLRIAGAVVVETPMAQVTHAVLPLEAVADGTCWATRSALSLAMVDAELAGGMPTKTAYMVSEAWVTACEKEGARAPETGYLLRELRDADG